ncbi:MAG: lysine--tRNA ligase [Alphaproteobacteria bacterium]|nr:lysine--tRNA ligase [Alphaproteobacteria bacterium]
MTQQAARPAPAEPAERAWPFQEARKLLDRLARQPADKKQVLFETGYGPSGLPHIGTFGEVARTSMVRHAFAALSDMPTRLIAFSDDMDGLRKVPDNVPNREALARHLGKPLTSVPDPFGTHDSFGAHNNARLRAFLDAFGFDYEFASSTEYYQAGRFDAALLAVLNHYEAILKVILPTLGSERSATYSPFLPLCPRSGRVLQAPVVELKVATGTIVYRDEDGRLEEVPVTGGHCKLQWKADWAMRWVALDVDYEMSGKDLIDSVKLSSQICRILGGRPPDGFTYELFLDEKGEKISKSRGNGLTIEEWLRYASPESLSLYMYQQPRRAKRLYFDVMPRAVDDYLGELAKYPGQGEDERKANPVWHIHSGRPPVEAVPVSFGLLLNLAGTAGTEDKTVLWGFIRRYAPEATPETHPILDRLVGYAIAYFRDIVKPARRFRRATALERAAFEELAAALEAMPPEADGEAVQNELYALGRKHGYANLRDWFRALYEVLFGDSQGPRMGSFAELYGVKQTAALIRARLADAAQPAA